MGGTTHSLPAALTPLVGRENDVREVSALVLEHRLVTLAGPPGIGKTRLAIEVATSLASFPEGRWFVDMAPISDPSLVARAVAAALGVREEPGYPLTDTLVAHLASRECLLVLDNCEHLVLAAAALAEMLLRECPGLSILTTSRETLGITGERTWRVPPLTVSATDEPDGVPAAVQLF
jgi:non-specific serine/threonine protein kinase